MRKMGSFRKQRIFCFWLLSVLPLENVFFINWQNWQLKEGSTEEAEDYYKEFL